jgi:hypothetical protein
MGFRPPSYFIPRALTTPGVPALKREELLQSASLGPSGRPNGFLKPLLDPDGGFTRNDRYTAVSEVKRPKL